MRNPRAGRFQGKGKNSTCSASPGRRGAGPSAGLPPLILGSTHVHLGTAGKASL